MVYLQCKKLCDPRWALQKWSNSLEALYKWHTFTFNSLLELCSVAMWTFNLMPAIIAVSSCSGYCVIYCVNLADAYMLHPLSRTPYLRQFSGTSYLRQFSNALLWHFSNLSTKLFCFTGPFPTNSAVSSMSEVMTSWHFRRNDGYY